MTALAAAGRRYLPRGWSRPRAPARNLVRVPRSSTSSRAACADRNPTLAFENGHAGDRLREPRERALRADLPAHRRPVPLARAARLAGRTGTRSSPSSCIALFWVYLRRNESFVRFRNTILLANLIGLVGYILMPTAPPRMFGLGFVDSLAQLSGLNHGSGLIQLAANPYAAMPSLHAADALIVGITLAGLCRNRIAKVVWIDLAGLGVVHGDGDRQPLLAGRAGRDHRRAGRDGAHPLAGAARASPIAAAGPPPEHGGEVARLVRRRAGAPDGRQPAGRRLGA